MRKKDIQGIVNDLINLEAWKNPLYWAFVRERRTFDLLSKKIAPEEKGDSISELMEDKRAWFQERIKNLKGNLNDFKKATITVSGFIEKIEIIYNKETFFQEACYGMTSNQRAAKELKFKKTDIVDFSKKTKKNKSLLLHVCCGPCSIGSLEKLKDYNVTLFFANSNIFPKEEYVKRFIEAKKVSKLKKIKIIEDKYNHAEWLSLIKGLEKEPERGKRCWKCFEYSLTKAAKKAKTLGLDYFTTTLTISKYKPSKKIFEIGNKIGKEIGIPFLELDFKKDDGYNKSIALSKENSLYRQDYCGCEFSSKIY